MSVPPLLNRIKLVIASRGTAIAAVLVVVGILAFAGAAWTLTHTQTVEVTEQMATHTVGTQVETRAVVTGNTSLWERDTILENKPIYPLRSAPRLTIGIDTRLPMGQEVQVTQELTLIYRATKDDTVFWQADRQLVSETQTVTDGDVSSSSTIDIREVRTHLDEINEEIRGLGRAQAYLRLNVSYQSAHYNGTISETAPMAILESGYWIGGSLDGENSHQTPITREVTQPPDTTKALGLGVIGLLSFGGAGGVIYASSRRLDPREIEAEINRGRYREWVSAGRLGQFVSGQDVAMDSLKDLVDVAIDSNNRVVHDTQRDLYAVVGDSVIFYYDPYHPEPEIRFEPEMEAPVQSDGGHHSAFDGESPVADDESEAEASADQAEAEPAYRRELDSAAVQVSRSAGWDDGRLVATYRIETDEPGYLEIDVADRLPTECDAVDSLEIQAGYEPVDSFGIDGGIGFRAVATAAAVRQVKYAVRTDGPPGGETLEAIEAAPPPYVRRVMAISRPDGG